MKIKKILLTGLLGAITVVSLASCNNNSNSNVPTPVTAETNEPAVTTPTDLKAQLLNCKNDEEALNLLGSHSLAEVQAVLEDEEVREKFTLSEQFVKLQSTLSSMDDSLKQIANNTNLVELIEQFSSTIGELGNFLPDFSSNSSQSESPESSGSSTSSGSSDTSGSSINSGSSSTVTPLPDATIGINESDSIASENAEKNYIEFNVIKDYDYRFSATDLNGNDLRIHKGKAYYSNDEAEEYPLEILPTHFSYINITYTENLSYSSINNLYNIIEIATKGNNQNYSNITLQGFSFDKINFVEVDEPYLFKTTTYSETTASGKTASHGTGQTKDYSQEANSSSPSGNTTNGSSQSESQGTSENWNEENSNFTSVEEGTNKNYYRPIYKVEGTNKLTLSFKIEFDKSVSLSDMLKTINLTSDAYTVELTNLYYD